MARRGLQLPDDFSTRTGEVAFLAECRRISYSREFTKEGLYMLDRPSRRGELSAIVVSVGVTVLLCASPLALADSQTALPTKSGPGWLDDYNLPISPTLIIQSEWVQRIGKVCSERKAGYDERFIPLFAKWKAAHLESLAAGEAQFRSMKWPPGVTPEAALATAGDDFELEFRGSPAEKVTVECASVLAELEDKTAASK